MTTTLQNCGGRGDAGNARRMRVGRAAVSGGVGSVANMQLLPIANTQCQFIRKSFSDGGSFSEGGLGIGNIGTGNTFTFPH